MRKTVIFIPNEVTVNIKDHYVFIEGNLGILSHLLNKLIFVKLNSFNALEVFSKLHNFADKALIGTTKSIINGMIIGVTLGFIKKLQLVGIGYRASVLSNKLNLVVGLSHSVEYNLPCGVQAQCLNQTEIILTGINKQLVGQVAADLRAIRPPEPFKGKGIRYEDEFVYIKDAKKR